MDSIKKRDLENTTKNFKDKKLRLEIQTNSMDEIAHITISQFSIVKVILSATDTFPIDY